MEAARSFDDAHPSTPQQRTLWVLGLALEDGEFSMPQQAPRCLPSFIKSGSERTVKVSLMATYRP